MKEYPKNKNYIVYEDGRILSKRFNKFLTPKHNWDGYDRLAIWEHGKNVCVGWHRIVAKHKKRIKVILSNTTQKSLTTS